MLCFICNGVSSPVDLTLCSEHCPIHQIAHTNAYKIPTTVSLRMKSARSEQVGDSRNYKLNINFRKFLYNFITMHGTKNIKFLRSVCNNIQYKMTSQKTINSTKCNLRFWGAKIWMEKRLWSVYISITRNNLRWFAGFGDWCLQRRKPWPLVKNSSHEIGINCSPWHHQQQTFLHNARSKRRRNSSKQRSFRQEIYRSDM